MLIRKRFVYLDAPLKIELKNETQIEETEIENERQKQLLELIAQANKQAEQMVFDAKARADEIVLQAQQEYNQIINQATEQAQQIIEKTNLEVQRLKENMNGKILDIIKSFDENLNLLLSMYAEKMTSISKILVEKFLEKQIDPEVTKRKLEKVLSHVVGATKVKLHINPQDIAHIDEQTLREIKSRGYEILPNKDVQYGVIAETDFGSIDTTLKFQFNLLDEIFEEVFKEES
ncbi:MAG: FliH/SctL family protein [Fervidobacterium sp.]